MPIAVDIDVMLARRKTSVGGSGPTRTPDSATRGAVPVELDWLHRPTCGPFPTAGPRGPEQVNVSVFEDGPAVFPLQFADLHADLQRIPLVVVVNHVVAAGVEDDVLTAGPTFGLEHDGSAAFE